MKLEDLISAPYMVGCTVGIIVSYAWHRWTLSNASLADTLVLTIASEAFILLWSILLVGRWRTPKKGKTDGEDRA